ncbi:MAG: MmcQ/YjbR family DNA-binding protein [Candidatus Nanopelagicales bacterium]
MATWEDVERIALSLPLVHEKDAGTGFEGWRVWKIEGSTGKQVVWERPMRPSDLKVLGNAAPTKESIAVRTPDFETKAQRIAEIDAAFDIPHFSTYTGLLVILDEVSVEDLQELVEESWLTVAPKRAAKAWLAERGAP